MEEALEVEEFMSLLALRCDPFREDPAPPPPIPLPVRFISL